MAKYQEQSRGNVKALTVEADKEFSQEAGRIVFGACMALSKAFAQRATADKFSQEAVDMFATMSDDAHALYDFTDPQSAA
jgi:hypothetical protein